MNHSPEKKRLSESFASLRCLSMSATSVGTKIGDCEGCQHLSIVVLQAQSASR